MSLGIVYKYAMQLIRSSNTWSNLLQFTLLQLRESWGISNLQQTMALSSKKVSLLYLLSKTHIGLAIMMIASPLLVIVYFLALDSFLGLLKNNLQLDEALLRMNIVLFWTVAEVLWVCHLLNDISVFLPSSPTLGCDNRRSISLASNHVLHSKMKHVDIDFHFIWELIQSKTMWIIHVSINDLVADVFTKGLSAHRFTFLRDKTSVQHKCSPQLAGDSTEESVHECV